MTKIGLELLGTFPRPSVSTPLDFHRLCLFYYYTSSDPSISIYWNSINVCGWRHSDFLASCERWDSNCLAYLWTTGVDTLFTSFHGCYRFFYSGSSDSSMCVNLNAFIVGGSGTRISWHFSRLPADIPSLDFFLFLPLFLLLHIPTANTGHIST